MFSVDDHGLQCFGEVVMAFVDIRFVAAGGEVVRLFVARLATEIKFAVELFITAQLADIIRHAQNGRIVVFGKGNFQSRELMEILQENIEFFFVDNQFHAVIISDRKRKIKIFFSKTDKNWFL